MKFASLNSLSASSLLPRVKTLNESFGSSGTIIPRIVLHRLQHFGGGAITPRHVMFSVSSLSAKDASSNAIGIATEKNYATVSQLESSVCPGCGVSMQSTDPLSPGYFVMPAVKEPRIQEATDQDLADMSVIAAQEEAKKKQEQEERNKWTVFESDGSKLVPVDEIEPHQGVRVGDIIDVSSIDDFSFSPITTDLAQLSDDEEAKRRAFESWSRLWEEDDDEISDKSRQIKKLPKREEVLEADEPEPEPAKVVVCARCHALRNYGRVKNELVENLLPDFDFDRVVGQRLRKAYGRRAVVAMVIDSSDFDGSFPRKAAQVLQEAEEATSDSWKEGQAGNSFRLVVVANKIDLLPKQVTTARLEQWVRRRAKAGGAPRVSALHLVSAYTLRGIEPLAEELTTLAGPRGDVWVIGAQNAGKSSLINALGKVAKAGAKGRTHLTEAALPGTTVGVIPLNGLLGARTRVIDTPGLIHPHQISTRLTREEQSLVLPRKFLKPRTYRLKVGNSVLVGGLVRLDLVEAVSETVYITVWASSYLTLHMGKTERAETVFDKHVGEKLTPPSSKDRLLELGPFLPRRIEVEGTRWDQSSTDVVIAGLGWFGVGLKGKASITVWTYEGVAVTIRDSMVFDMAHTFEKAGFTAGSSTAGKGKESAKEKQEARRKANVEIIDIDNIDENDI